MTIDSGFQTIYLADRNEQELIDVDYESMLSTYTDNFDIYGDKNLYEALLFGNDSSLDYVDALCWDYDSRLYWTGS